MPEHRKKYDREFREGAVRIVNETKKPIAQVARDLGVTVSPTYASEPRLMKSPHTRTSA
jgi:transposase-like protein